MTHPTTLLTHREFIIQSALILLAVASLAVDCQYLYGQEKMEYPSTEQVDQVDDFFGTLVKDPYRWLEQDVREEEKVQAWVDAQNAITNKYLESLPGRKQIETRLTELWDYEKFGIPSKHGDRYFYFKNDGLQNQSVLYKSDQVNGAAEVLLDPNRWSDDGTEALSGMAFSDDGKLLAYGVQKSGSDWRTYRVLEVESGKVLDDKIEWMKFSGVAWTNDNLGFFYSRYAEPTAEEEFQSLNLGQNVYYHTLGQPQSDDELIYEDPEHPEYGFMASVTEDGRYLVLTNWVGTDDRYRILYRDLKSDDKTTKVLIDKFENEYSLIGNEGSKLYFKSDLNAPKKCILTIDLGADRAGTEQIRAEHIVVPESKEAMESASIVGDYLILSYLADAKSQVKIYDLAGNFVREVNLPGIGTAGGMGGRRDHSETFYSFSSFNRPPSSYQYDLKTGNSELVRTAKVDFNPDDFEVKQLFFASKDGTRVPMFVAHKKGIKLDGKNPTLLYGYGGFNISLTPSFSISKLQWMEMGGIYVMANLRGGGEYGKEWHKAGTLTNKQNVFDDFIAAAEYLIDQKYTSSDHLAIQGRSNGGLLVGACMAQRPDLYAACLPAVGVMDMLRFQKFTAGRFWVDDYGDADKDPDHFKALYAYSPYHNLKDGTKYPATMISTADHDDRVVPGHSFKFAARLQEAHQGDNPVLIRIETKAGHGAGKPTSKVIEEVTDEWAFLAKHLGLKIEDAK
jgi:prolyl oligopeptidase